MSSKGRFAPAVGIVGGLHSVRALLRNSRASVRCLLVQSERQDARLKAVIQLATGSGIVVEERSRAELDQLSNGLEHQGVLAELSTEQPTRHDLLEHLNSCNAPWLVLVLDEIQDPHNLGACLRSADAAGVDAVVVPSDNSAGLTPVVRKVACGAAETVALFRVPNLQRSLKQLQEAGVWVFGAAGEADAAVYDIDFRVSTALVMGAEGKGLRRLTRERCDQLFQIPMAGTVESLNVSVATGVALFEIRRQRGVSIVET